MSALLRLRDFARGEKPGPGCQLCGSGLGDDHPHLVEIPQSKLLCVCGSCAVLLGQSSEMRYRRVPERARRLSDFRMSDDQWDALGIPVDLAFFYRSTRLSRTVALYPSPLGATECLLPLESWDGIVAANPAVQALEPDVEALLVNRVRHRRDFFSVPIDACYRLVGLVRKGWAGFSGGDVWETVDRFFEDLRLRCEAPR